MVPLKSPAHLCILVAFVFFVVVLLRRSDSAFKEELENVREVMKDVAKSIEKKKNKSHNFSKIWTAKGDISYEEAEAKVFRPMGYRIIEDALVPVLELEDRPTCSKIFEDWLAGSRSQDESATPPKDIPPKLLNQYTLNGYSKLVMGYCNDRSGVQFFNWTKEVIDQEVSKEAMDVDNYSGEGRAVYHAMKAYGIKGQSGIIIGSISPWVEGFAIRLGASMIKTIEYARISTPKEYPWMTYSHPVEIAKYYDSHIGVYDFAASFSSIEHSGLGRFGDALDPIGDIKEMLKIHCMLKEGALFFLGFQTGRDAVYWNLHRGYGRLRLAIMVAGFEIVDLFRSDERIAMTDKFFLDLDGAQPVIVLRKKYSNSIARV